MLKLALNCLRIRETRVTSQPLLSLAPLMNLDSRLRSSFLTSVETCFTASSLSE